MSRINSNVNSLIAQRILGQNNNQLTKSLERLSTGLAINRGSDNPAGLIASEKLRIEKAGLSAAIGNAQRADQIANIAEGGLQEISTLLVEVQSLVGQTASDAGLSTEEKQANQLQIDQIIQTIDRISSVTSFQGTKLLNGRLDFTVEAVDTDVTAFQINGAKFETGSDLDVSVVVTQSAHRAQLMLSTGGALDFGDNPDEAFVFEVGGVKGAKQFSFSSGTALADMATAINGFKSVTGVSATVSGGGLSLRSLEYGSSEFVSVKVIDDAGGNQTGAVQVYTTDDYTTADGTGETALSAASTTIRGDGQDIGASINGIKSSGEGLAASVNSDSLDLSLTLGETAATTLAAISPALTITGGGATFNLGSSYDLNNQVRIGIGNFAARNLGNETDGWLTDLGSGGTANVVNGDLEAAQKVVAASVDKVTTLRGRLGSFQKFVVGSTINALNVALENTTAAESAIRDTDFANETANLTRNQVLVAAASSVLQIANNTPQNVLNLL